MFVEENQSCYAVDHVSTLVHDNNSSRTETTVHRYQCIKVHENIITDPCVIVGVWRGGGEEGRDGGGKGGDEEERGCGEKGGG